MHQTSMVRALNPATLFGGRTMPVENPERAPQSRSARARAGLHVAPDEQPLEGKREWNPTNTTWLLLTGATAVIVGATIALWPKGAKAAPGGTVPGNEPGGGTEPGGGPPHHPKGNYLGGANFGSWPHMDVFPTAQSILDTMHYELGYTVGSGPLSKQTMLATRQFEIDYNDAVDALAGHENDLAPWNLPGVSLPRPPSGHITVDNVTKGMGGQKGGLIGTGVIDALWRAIAWKQLLGWSEIYNS